MLLILGAVKQMLWQHWGQVKKGAYVTWHHWSKLKVIVFIWISLWLVLLSILPSVIIELVERFRLLLCLYILCPFSCSQKHLPFCHLLPSTASSYSVVLG